MNIPVEADFVADLRGILAATLAGGGYTVGAALSTGELLVNWLKTQHRRIERKKRRVEWSSDLRARQPQLPERTRAALHRIENAVEGGDDLAPYLSRELVTDKAFKRNDLMLNELGVHHFHLGEGTDARGLVEGTNELLFATVTEAAVHFIDVFDHASFGDERAFKIAQANWPHLFEDARLGSSRSEPALTPEQRKTLRAKRANVTVAASDGTPFLPPGGGLTPSGTSINVVISADMIFARLTTAERWCKENGLLLADRIEAATGRRPDSFALRFNHLEASGVVVVIDDKLRARFEIDPS